MCSLFLPVDLHSSIPFGGGSHSVAETDVLLGVLARLSPDPKGVCWSSGDFCRTSWIDKPDKMRTSQLGFSNQGSFRRFTVSLRHLPSSLSWRMLVSFFGKEIPTKLKLKKYAGGIPQSLFLSWTYWRQSRKVADGIGFNFDWILLRPHSDYKPHFTCQREQIPMWDSGKAFWEELHFSCFAFVGDFCHLCD